MPPYYCRPSWNASQWGTWDVTAGTDDPLYPAVNVRNLDPSFPTKSTTANLTLRVTWGAPQRIPVVQFVMHNLGGRPIGITNSAGLNTTLTPAPNTADGFPEFSWKDLRYHPQNTAAQWSFAMSVNAGVVHIGEIACWYECLFLPLLWKTSHGPRRLAHRNVTDWGYEHYYDRGIRERFIEGNLIDGDYRQALFDLEADARGPVRQFPLILEDEKQDSYWVRFSQDEFAASRDAPRIARMSFNVHETGLGLAP